MIDNIVKYKIMSNVKIVQYFFLISPIMKIKASVLVFVMISYEKD